MEEATDDDDHFEIDDGSDQGTTGRFLMRNLKVFSFIISIWCLFKKLLEDHDDFGRFEEEPGEEEEEASKT